MISRARTLALSAGLLSSTLSGVAAASELSWDGPAECAQREQLLFQVERALGSPLERVAALHFQVHVDLSGADARARLQIAGTDAAAVKERRLVAADCDKLVDTLAVAIALTIEAASAPEPAPASVSEPTLLVRTVPESAALAAPIGAEVAPPPSKKEGEPSAGATPRAAVWLLGDSGSLPAPAVGMALGLELGWSRLQIRLLGTLWLEQHTELDAANLAGTGADLNLVTGGLLACTRPLGTLSEAFSASLCGGMEVGRLSGTGRGVLEARSQSALWLAPGVQADVYWNVPATRLRVGALLAGAMPLNRDAFVLDDLGTVHQPAGLVGRAGLGVDVTLE